MARRNNFERLIVEMAREKARQQKEEQQLQARREREAIQAQRAALRNQMLSEKEAKQKYIETREFEVNHKNRRIEITVSELNQILDRTLLVNDTITFTSLRNHKSFKKFEIPAELQKDLPAPKKEDFSQKIKKPNSLEKLIPGVESRFLKAMKDAENQYEEAKKKHEAIIAERERKINDLRVEYEKSKSDYEQELATNNRQVDAFENAYQSGDPDAVISYCSLVLERSDYPDGFPQEFRIAYVPEPKELVIEYELPTKEIVPGILEYRYVKSKDSIEEKPRKAAEINNLYQDIIASVCLRTIHEIVESDQNDHISVVAFNGFVSTIDPSTGQDIQPHLISVRTTKERFNELNLSRIEKRACLRNLGAQISPKPDEMVPVKPVVEFDMVDKRFVEQSDILGDLDSRPNLMELNPFEFENLVSNLFEKIGFQAKLTRSSKDGGVDAIAYDPRPILGGKVVIQAKRYKNVVGVSAVRDLYGTMINEGANKGILVSTSHYGPDAYDFSKDKPIELIDGSRLLYLLEEQGIKAKIIFLDE